MLDWDLDDRTEQPTPERRQEARRQGRVARSRDLVAGISLLGTAALLGVFGPSLLGSLTDGTRSLLAEVGAAGRGFEAGWVQSLAFRASAVFAVLLVPVASCGALGAAAANAAQGAVFLRAAGVDFARLHPLSALRRIFSARNIARGALLLAKVALVSAMFAKTILKSLGELSASDAIGRWEAWWRQGISFGLRSSAALVALGLLEYALERWWLERDLRMTRAEREEETARSEGKSEYKSARRKAGKKLLTESMRPARGIRGVEAT